MPGMFLRFGYTITVLHIRVSVLHLLFHTGILCAFSRKSWVFANFAMLKSGEIWGILLHGCNTFQYTKMQLVRRF